MFVPDPVAFNIFGLGIRWYAILICAGMIIATAIAYKRAPGHGIDPDSLLDYVLVGLPCGIIGARAYYVLFNWSYYSDSLFRIINIREGGLAIHGGLIFGLGSVYILSRMKKDNVLNIFDLTAPCLALAQSIGRWGNFFNQEAYGGPTDLPWAILVDGEYVHPTFLYESLWCLLLFFVLSYVDKRRKFTGQVILLYGILYSLERFFVESLRTDSLMLGPFKQAMVLSAAAFAVCVILDIVLARRHRGGSNGSPAAVRRTGKNKEIKEK